LELFKKYPSILEFYQNYFSAIIVDEFQDTNLLSWALLKRIISEDSRVIFIGDSLQRIYGFIGAIPDLMLEARQLYNMDTISLKKNYRFKDNPQMLQLDKNIRLNAEDPKNPVIVNDAEILFCNPRNQEEEAKEILNKISALEIVNSDKSYKVAILVKKNKGNDIDKIFNCLSNNNIPYYYALFSDKDYDYLRFHRECYFRFNEQIKNERVI
jgi:DNA helicase-2/ATP-dependent DNA helicase PcrA